MKFGIRYIRPTSPLFLGNMAMGVTVLLWGSSFVSIKIAVTAIPPVTMAFIRFTMATALLFIILKVREPGSRIGKQDYGRIGLAGLLGVTLYFFFENKGVRLSTASNAALITAVIPVLATALDAAINKSKVTAAQAGGMLLALIGSVLAITSSGRVSLESSHFRGNLLIIGAMITWSLYTLCAKSIGARYTGLTVTCYQYLAGTVFLLPLALTEYKEWKPVPLSVWGHLLFLAVFCSAGCYLLYHFALKTLDVMVTTMYLNLVPVIGVAGSHMYLRESLLPIQLLGGGMILAAIAIVNLRLPFLRKSTLDAPFDRPPQLDYDRSN